VVRRHSRSDALIRYDVNRAPTDKETTSFRAVVDPRVIRLKSMAAIVARPIAYSGMVLRLSTLLR
jgi:hypothetical protein